MRRFFAFAVTLALLPGLGRADERSTAAQNLAAHRHAEQLARAASRADAAQAAELAEQQVEAAFNLRRLEDKTSADAEQLGSLATQQQTTSQRLQTAQTQLEKLLPVMQRLSAQPEATLLAAPQSPADAVRGIAILQGIAAEIAARARDVQTQSARETELMRQAQAAQARLEGAVAAQQAAEDALSVQIASAKSAEMEESDTAAREAEASLAAQRKLDSLTAAVTNLVTASAVPANLPAGAGGAPVAGRIVQAYGATTPAGPATGVSYGAAPGARVVTPCAGTVMFAGAFPAYGLMVIADCGGGTSVVLAGMNHLDVSTGQQLAHGQPVGAMLGFDAANPARQPVLYVELRQNGTPVDPTAWLAGHGTG